MRGTEISTVATKFIVIQLLLRGENFSSFVYSPLYDIERQSESGQPKTTKRINRRSQSLFSVWYSALFFLFLQF